jgi:hypothetical protein
MRRLIVAWLLTVCVSACGGSGSSAPMAPTVVVVPQTRAVSLSGSLAFGELVVGSSREIPLTLSNGGNAPLSVSGLSVTGDLNSHVAYSWGSGQIAAGGSQIVGVRFVPTRPGVYSGTLIVAGDQTSGTNSIAISGTALPNFSGRWSGGHRIDQCGGIGGLADLLCTPGRPFAVSLGTILNFSSEIAQNGTNITGTVNVGGISGPVTGVVSSSGLLTLRGNLTATNGLSATITTWNVTLGGSQTSWSGSIGYDIRDRTTAGVAVIVASMNGVNKQ